jgi:hypothetical protein
MVTGIFTKLKPPSFLKELIMSDNVFIISIALAVFTAICALGHDSYVSTKSIERNIESAIVKGIDPLAVRCAYAKRDDTICIVYASSHNSPSSLSSSKK